MVSQNFASATVEEAMSQDFMVTNKKKED